MQDGNTGSAALQGDLHTRNLTAHLISLIESTSDLIWSVDLEYRLVTFNQAFSDQLKENGSLAVKPGLNPFDFMPSAQAA
jgi:PAS domain-containing protein